MGWTYMPKPTDVKKYLDETVTWETEQHRNRVLDSAIVNRREYYAAVERTCKDSGEVEVWCAVDLLSYAPNGDTFGHKEMTERMGPVVDNCPERILKLLSPITPSDADDSAAHALEWRRRCREKIEGRRRLAKKFEVGRCFHHADGLSFGGYEGRVHYLVCIEAGRRKRFMTLGSGGAGFPCRLTKPAQMALEALDVATDLEEQSQLVPGQHKAIRLWHGDPAGVLLDVGEGGRPLALLSSGSLMQALEELRLP